MPQLTDLTGLFSIASVLTALASCLPRVAALPKKPLAIFLTVIFVLLLIPFGDIPLAAYARGMVGDLSITSVVLALMKIANVLVSRVSIRQIRLKPDLRQYQHLWILIAITALVFYPMTLGISLIDPYRLGYGELIFVASLLTIALAAWLMRLNLIALCLALAILTWSLGWYESANLWDYLIDPLLASYSLGLLIQQGMKKCFNG